MRCFSHFGVTATAFNLEVSELVGLWACRAGSMDLVAQDQACRQFVPANLTQIVGMRLTVDPLVFLGTLSMVAIDLRVTSGW